MWDEPHRISEPAAQTSMAQDCWPPHQHYLQPNAVHYSNFTQKPGGFLLQG